MLETITGFEFTEPLAPLLDEFVFKIWAPREDLLIELDLGPASEGLKLFLELVLPVVSQPSTLPAPTGLEATTGAASAPDPYRKDIEAAPKKQISLITFEKKKI